MGRATMMTTIADDNPTSLSLGNLFLAIDPVTNLEQELIEDWCGCAVLSKAAQRFLVGTPVPVALHAECIPKFAENLLWEKRPNRAHRTYP